MIAKRVISIVLAIHALGLITGVCQALECQTYSRTPGGYYCNIDYYLYSKTIDECGGSVYELIDSGRFLYKCNKILNLSEGYHCIGVDIWATGMLDGTSEHMPGSCLYEKVDNFMNDAFGGEDVCEVSFSTVAAEDGSVHRCASSYRKCDGTTVARVYPPADREADWSPAADSMCLSEGEFSLLTAEHEGTVVFYNDGHYAGFADATGRADYFCVDANGDGLDDSYEFPCPSDVPEWVHEANSGGDNDDDDGGGCEVLTWYKDADGDGYSDGASLAQCERPEGYKLAEELEAASGDCEDDPVKGGSGIHPGAEEVCDGRDNNCNNKTDEGVVTATIDRTWVYPKNAGGGNTQADVNVWLISPSKDKTCTVELKVEPVQKTGGHMHTASRPASAIGELSTNEVTLSAGNKAMGVVTYASSFFSGDERIYYRVKNGQGVTVSTSGNTTTVQGADVWEDYLPITVKVPHLHQMSGPHLRLTGNTSYPGTNHPDNHYATVFTITSTWLVSEDYYDNEKLNAILGINDMSLEYGGGFDIYGNWTDDIATSADVETPTCGQSGHGHCSHRKGTSVDIDTCAKSAADPNIIDKHCTEVKKQYGKGYVKTDKGYVGDRCRYFGKGRLVKEATIHCEFPQ